ncbi:hypothetical protein [Leptospira kirschneri]|uniref:hypothetical protein n=1 Tax=Leptospira kirschneri TaxID=29507 RepID=UPI0035626C45
MRRFSGRSKLKPSHSQWIVRSNSASHSQWIVRSNSASHSQWIVRSNSASHSQWIVRQVAFYIETKTIYYIKFLACNLLTRTKCPSATPDLLRLSYFEFTGLKCELYWDRYFVVSFLTKS